MRTRTVIDSVVGPLTLVADEGAIVGLYMDLQRHRPADDKLGEPDLRGCARLSRSRPPPTSLAPTLPVF